MSTTLSGTIRENTIVRHMSVRAAAVASAGASADPVDLAAVVEKAIWALPDGVARLKKYLLATGFDPVAAGKIDRLTHGGGGELYIEICDFQYSPGSTQFNPMVIAQSVFTNPTNAEITEQFSYSKTLTDTFMFKFTEGLKIGTSAKFKAGLPLVGEGEVAVSGEVSFGAEQQWTSTESKTWTASLSIKIPAQQRIRVTASLSLAKITASFTCKARVTGCPGYLVGTGTKENDACMDVVMPLGAFFPDPAELPFQQLSGTLTGSEGVNVVVLTENV